MSLHFSPNLAHSDPKHLLLRMSQKRILDFCGCRKLLLTLQNFFRSDMKVFSFLKDWALIISILSGIAAYLIYAQLPVPDYIRPMVWEAVSVAQPAMIFAMLFLTFCKINLRSMRLCRWHLWLLLIQGGAFSVIGLILIFMPHSGARVVLEGAMICLICPTATAAPVITRKLGGDITHITTYTILINLTASLLIPALLPFVHPQPGMSTLNASLLILGKVFPLLLLPLVSAVLLRQLWPKLHHIISGWVEASFYIWMVSLALALAVSTRSICHSTVSISTEAWLVAVSLACCVAQFYFGRRIGAIYGDKVTAGQALGQKNTVLAIWMGYTFFTPVTSIVGGFYSIWHNVINSYQLYIHKKRQKP